MFPLIDLRVNEVANLREGGSIISSRVRRFVWMHGATIE